MNKVARLCSANVALNSRCQIYSCVPLRIILVRPKEPANVGAAARAMKNFGLGALYLVSPQRPLGKRAFALASHAGDVLDRAVRCDTLAQAVAGCKLVLGTTARPRTNNQRVYSAREAAQSLPADEVAAVFGPEDFGLSNEDLEHCQGYIQIPTSDYASLNLAQAVQLVAYEWFVAHQVEVGETRDLSNLAPRETLEPMYAQLIQMLHLIGYTDAQREASARELFRGIFDRAELSEREVLALRGLWRQVTWAVKNLPKDEL